MTGSRLLARNTTLNLIGVSVPMVAAFVAIPLLIAGMGTARFGILTIGWVLVGYFGLFDLGLGRALTKMVAERLATERVDEVPSLVWTGIIAMIALGTLGGVVLALLAPWLVYGVLNIPPELEPEALLAFYLLAGSLPWVLSTAGLLGVLEASQAFGVVNALRIPMGIFNYLGPLAALAFSHSLVPVIAVLVAGRVVGWFAHLAMCLRVMPVLRARAPMDWQKVKALVRFGGWMAISNMISPIMTHLDRFLIGSLLTVSAVAYYVTPYEVVMKLLVFPTALIAVLFPAFAATFARDRTQTVLLFDRGVRAIFLLMFPPILLILAFAREGMTLWMGADFASQSTIVLQWLAAGVFVCCIAQAPFVLVQGVGRPDIIARLHLVEAPLYILAMWGLSQAFGIAGVAMAWTARVVADALVLFIIAERLVPTRPVSLRAGRMILGGGLAIAAAVLAPSLGLRMLLVAAILGAFAWIGWSTILTPAERSFVLGFVTERWKKPHLPPDQPAVG